MCIDYVKHIYACARILVCVWPWFSNGQRVGLDMSVSLMCEFTRTPRHVYLCAVRARRLGRTDDSQLRGTRIHTCMHTYIHTYIHTHIHAYTHIYIHDVRMARTLLARWSHMTIAPVCVPATIILWVWNMKSSTPPWPWPCTQRMKNWRKSWLACTCVYRVHRPKMQFEGKVESSTPLWPWHCTHERSYVESCAPLHRFIRQTVTSILGPSQVLS